MKKYVLLINILLILSGMSTVKWKPRFNLQRTICTSNETFFTLYDFKSVTCLGSTYFIFYFLSYIQDCGVQPNASDQARIWPAVPIPVAVESVIQEKEHPYSRHEIFQIGFLP